MIISHIYIYPTIISLEIVISIFFFGGFKVAKLLHICPITMVDDTYIVFTPIICCYIVICISYIYIYYYYCYYYYYYYYVLLLQILLLGIYLYYIIIMLLYYYTIILLYFKLLYSDTYIYIYIIALYYYNYLVDPTEATPGCRTTSHGRPQTMTSTKVSAPSARWKPWFSHGKRVFFLWKMMLLLG